MAQQKLPAIFVTEEHLLIGQIPTRGSRLLETLTDPNSDCIQLDDVHVARRESKGHRLKTLKQVMVRKHAVRLAILGGGKHESPETRRFAYVDKQNYAAFAIVSGYEVEGRLQLKGAAEPVLALTRELKSFIPITHATISHAGGNAEPLTAAVVLCSRDHISVFHIGDSVDDAEIAAGRAKHAAAGVA
jgi:hypothetical protein